MNKNIQSQLCDKNQWCTFESVDHTSIKVQISFLGLMFLLTILIIIYLIKLYKFRVDERYVHLFGKVFVRVYQIVVAWLFCTILKLVINVIAYHYYISQDYNHFQPPSNHSIVVILSGIFIIFDQSSTFFIVCLIILIPYQWFNYFMEHLNDINLEIPLGSRKLFWLSFKILRIVKIYIKLRFVLILGYIAEGVLIVETDYGCNLPSIVVAVVIGESILSFLFYIFAFYVAEHTRAKNLITMQKQDYKKIRIEYTLLMFALLVRILLNIFFNGFVSSMLDYHPQVNCFDSNSDNDFKRSLFLVLGFAIMHFLPIGIILYIYRPSLEERQSFQNILRSQQHLIDQSQDSQVITTRSPSETLSKRTSIG